MVEFISSTLAATALIEQLMLSVLSETHCMLTDICSAAALTLADCCLLEDTWKARLSAEDFN
jgi:hypothetical protein